MVLFPQSFFPCRHSVFGLFFFFFCCSNYLIAPVWIITLYAIRKTADLLVQYPVCRKREETVSRKWKRPGDWAPELWRSFLRIGQWYFALFYQRVNQITWRRGLSFTFLLGRLEWTFILVEKRKSCNIIFSLRLIREGVFA